MSHSLYEIKKLKLYDKQLEEWKSLMDEKLFTYNEIRDIRNSAKEGWSWPSFILGTLIGIFIFGIVYVLHHH